MNKKFTILFIYFLSAHLGFSQQWVSTTPENKRAIVEEFTGVACPGCPAGADDLEHLLQAYSDQVYVVGYHHPNTPFCIPYGNDPDFRRSFLSAYASPTFNFMGMYPSAFVNRRMWAGETYRNIVRQKWEQKVQTILSEPSPLNIGLNPVYDPTTKVLSIDVEIYYTSTITDPITIYVQFAESGIVAIQKNGSVLDSHYIHKHVFRECLTSQWGNPLSNTTIGSLFTNTFTFDNSITQYNMQECEVAVLVRNALDEEIITVNKKMVDLSTTVQEINKNNITVFPNPFDQSLTINYTGQIENLRMLDLLGHDLTDQIKINPKNRSAFELDVSKLPHQNFYLIKTDTRVFKVWKE
jgi:hypothetical protein